jgi:TusA-related sulfurtransferase
VTASSLELDDLGLDSGAHLLLRRALDELRPGEQLVVHGADPALPAHLAAWCRAEGHLLQRSEQPRTSVVIRGAGRERRWSGAVRAGDVRSITACPPAAWGMAARGALLEAGGPEPYFDLDDRDLVWADVAPQLYAHAAARQWDPATAVQWDQPFTHDDDVESAVVQVMTYLLENEQAALLVPARFLGRIHPHFREVLQLLTIQMADEARHLEIFGRRALLRRPQLGTSAIGGRASLFTLMAESDFTLASFLLSVLGEGTFVDLLHFLHEYGPDPVTRRVAWLAMQDERRHVLFGVAHLAQQSTLEPGLVDRLRAAIERRHDALRDTAGLNTDVFDALVVLAAGSWTPAAIRQGHKRVHELEQRMDEGRRRRLERLGFPADEAAELSALHTRNFM